MLLPNYLGLCSSQELDAGHQASSALKQNSFGTAIAVSITHTLAMIASGGLVAFAVYQWLGPRFIARSWFNLETVWAMSLIIVGFISMAVLY